MFSRFRLIRKYIHYYVFASNGKGHGIHSPFVFDFIRNVLNDQRDFYAYQQIENLRQVLLKDETKISFEDFGAGSAVSASKKRSVAEIAKSAAKSKKFGRLLFRIVNYYQPGTIIELGTSLGLSAAYLGSASRSAKLVTMEGSPAIAAIAKKNLRSIGLPDIELVLGNFDDALPAVLKKHPVVDFAFIDGNHRKQPTLAYYDQFADHMAESSILMFDDIHWSREMEEAWRLIKCDGRTMLTIDLFSLGLVFFKKDFSVKQHFTLRF
jgi:predicted O-methyltransferase YrrM